jgi:asparagine synthase (glutamine-hydrolysing)
MCGLAGLLAPRAIPELPQKLARMSDLLRHRGPDDHGFLTWGDGGVVDLGRDPERLAPGRLALVHRRLSIFDLSESGWQPMRNAAGDAWIVFNGEIYNHRELRTELEADGRTFHSSSDTEVLLALLDRDGVDCLRRVVGMYAFAHVDLSKRRLLLARDPLGIKPLHYASNGGLFAFASEIKPLFAVGAASTRVEPAALFRYLRHAVTNLGDGTVFADVRELEPGRCIEVSLDNPENRTTRRFWEPKPGNAPRRIAPADAASELRGLLRRSVELHLRADVPCAAALSGGVDSSGIVAIMREHLGAAAPIDVFSYIADDERLSEQRWVSIAAKATGARVHEVRLEPDRLAEEVDDLITSQEQPFTTTSMWAQAHVYRAARAAGFKIVLDGQGADEAFAGYAVFRAARLEGLIRRGRIAEARQLLAAMPGGRAGAMLPALGGLLPDALRGVARRAVGKPIAPDWINAGWFGPAAVEFRPDRAAAHSPLAAALRDSVMGSSLPMLLRYADRNAMASSIENRVPYLTPDIMDFAFGLPDDILIAPDGTLKNVLRDALRGVAPDAILDRRDKIGFETPEASWFARYKSVRALASDTARMPLPPCFAPSLRDDLAALGAGKMPFSPHLWRCMNVIRWSERLAVDWGSAA